jgi:uncharacterized membrane protein YdcZ (DUF606 family)
LIGYTPYIDRFSIAVKERTTMSVFVIVAMLLFAIGIWFDSRKRAQKPPKPRYLVIDTQEKDG